MEYTLPIFLLGLGFLIKLWVNKETTKPHLLTSVSELPVDIMFLSSALIISYTELQTKKVVLNNVRSSADVIASNINNGYIIFIGYIIITFIITAIWRWNRSFFEAERWVVFNIILIVKLGLAIYCLYHAITKLNEVM
ncbi:hypothetical protein [Alkalihalobacillus sp. AL-G]|uniref:hypothetical protein n=1 Tax=Alkalihalobacillus sp. AL-G TaxID=2926399 RepID=UPI00272A266E|nr:hypothetical protein [Alkalihalobacillus sp. AL-G]WLD91769.1 hypothetical protein MOJ78_12045 [Alkalihalobacillus sp. AL-G]